MEGSDPKAMLQGKPSSSPSHAITIYPHPLWRFYAIGNLIQLNKKLEISKPSEIIEKFLVADYIELFEIIDINNICLTFII